MTLDKLRDKLARYDGKTRVCVALYTTTQNGAVTVDKTPIFDVYKNGGVVYIRANGRDKTKQKEKRTYDKRSLKSV